MKTRGLLLMVGGGGGEGGVGCVGLGLEIGLLLHLGWLEMVGTLIDVAASLRRV